MILHTLDNTDKATLRREVTTSAHAWCAAGQLQEPPLNAWEEPQQVQPVEQYVYSACICSS